MTETDTGVPEKQVREWIQRFRSWANQSDRDLSAMSDTERATVASYERCADELERELEANHE